MTINLFSIVFFNSCTLFYLFFRKDIKYAVGLRLALQRQRTNTFIVQIVIFILCHRTLDYRIMTVSLPRRYWADGTSLYEPAVGWYFYIYYIFVVYSLELSRQVYNERVNHIKHLNGDGKTYCGKYIFPKLIYYTNFRFILFYLNINKST